MFKVMEGGGGRMRGVSHIQSDERGVRGVNHVQKK